MKPSTESEPNGPQLGKHYAVKHNGVVILAKLLAVEEHEGRRAFNKLTGSMQTYSRACTRYRFLNTHTGREIVLKSWQKVKSDARD